MEIITREYNATQFLFREDGWFNMTQAAKAYGKQLNNFWNLRDTQRYLVARVVKDRCDRSLGFNERYQVTVIKGKFKTRRALAVICHSPPSHIT